jgi:hypothetical protein
MWSLEACGGPRTGADRKTHSASCTDGFSYAFATGDCGPTDLPAVAFYLLDEHDDSIPPKTNSRYIRVRVFSDRESLTDERLEWAGSRGPGDAQLCSNGSCDAMTSGYVNVGEVRVGKAVEGELDLRFTNDMRVRKRFHGHWVRSRFMCP